MMESVFSLADIHVIAMRRGLIVGKFMPLHRGHQLLIETALANVDQLTVVVYDTFVDEASAQLMPADKRARWIYDLYPNLENVVVMPDPELEDGADKDDPKYARVYADQLAFLGPFTHVFSSEDYGAPFAGAFVGHGWMPQHVTVDAARELMPISGTAFRSDMYKYRAFVDPLVYRSLIQKVVFVGTESTGKSTLSALLGDVLHTRSTQEYGRTLWAQHQDNGTTPSFHDLWDIGHTQYEQEQAAVLHSNRFLFCDTNAWTTMLWSLMYHNAADARLIDLARKTVGEYKWFLCSNDFDWVDDGTRELKDGKANDFQKTNVRALNKWGIPYELLFGSLNARVDKVKKALDASYSYV